MRIVLRVTFALAAGAAIAAACYWGFLNTPESRTWLLFLSALLAVLLVLTVAASISMALLLASGESWSSSAIRAVRAIPLFFIAAAPALLGIWLVLRFDTWLAANYGAISAWFIDAFNWGDVRWLFSTEGYVSEWLRWLVFPLAALALLHAMLTGGGRAAFSARWLRAGWHWRTLAVATLAYVLLMRLPWQWVTWRPLSIPATWIEPAFAAVRLGVIVALTVLGAALTTTVLARRSAAP